MNEDVVLYFLILSVLIYFYQKKTSWGFLKFLQETAADKKISSSDIIKDNLKINEKLSEDVKGYKKDTNALKWIIIVYLIYGVLELFLV